MLRGLAVLNPSSIASLVLVAVMVCSIGAAHGATTVVPAGSDPLANGDAFQSTVNAAACGDTIVLQAGVVYAARMISSNSYGPQGNSFTMPNKNCASNQWVTIQTSALGNLPSGRVGYSDIPSMATLASNSNSPVITYANNAGWYKWIGILFTLTGNVAANRGFNPNIVDTAQGGYGPWPHDIFYDRVVIRPYEESLNPVPNTVRSSAIGIRLDGANMTLQNSYVSGFCCKQSNDGVTNIQSEAVVIVNGPGPYTLTNNFLEAYGWNILTGGGGGMAWNTATVASATMTSATLSNVTNLHVGDAIRFRYSAGYASGQCNGGRVIYGSAVVDSINGTTITFHWLTPGAPSLPPDSPGEAAWNGVNPSNLTIRQNRLHKRTEWAANSGQCKAFWEMKAGSNVLFEGNTLTGPLDATSGSACPITTALATNQDGSNPWAATNNNVFRNNLMIGVGSIFSVQPYDSYCGAMPGSGMTFTNNLLGRINGTRFSFFENTRKGSNWVISHNTVRSVGNSIFHPDANWPDTSNATYNVTFVDNLVESGGYWIQTLDLTPTLYPGMVQHHNVIINNSGYGQPSYTSSDMVVTSTAAVGFVNVSDADAGGDYHGYALSSSSPFKGRASDGTDPGVNFTTLDAVLAAPAPSSGGGTAPPSGGGTAPSPGPAAPTNLIVR